MLYYVLTGLINAIASSFLGLFVYLTNKKNPVNRQFALFCLSVAAWSWAYIFWPGAQDKNTALLAFRVLHIGSIFVSTTYLHFVLTFLDLGEKKKKLLIFGYFLSFVFLIFDFTNLFIRDMVPKFGFKFWAEPGILYHFYLLMFFTWAMYSWWLLAKAHEHSEGQKKVQIQYILLGTLIGFLGGSTNYFLWYNVPIPPVGNGLVVLYIILTAVAVARYHLFDIKVILTEILVGAIGILLLVQIFLSQSTFDYIWRGSLFFLFTISGSLLVRGVLQEIKYREKLQDAYQELQKLDKAKSEFVSIASHQLRTPLTAIKGYVSLLLEGSYGKLTDKNRPPIENVYQSTERLIKLINELLNISRIEAGGVDMNFEETPIEEVINLAMEETKMQAEKKKLYLKLEKPEASLPKIFIDKDKMKQVIMNLMDNAIKYTNQGGVTIRAKSHDSKVRIEISDTGDGMAEEEISKLFKSFSRGSAGNKLSAEGAGLGLHIAKRFVDFHNGRIWAESPGKGKGSTVFIELPIRR
ncbi:MAG: ATP-binding protein [Candidatus Nealsonbacteria bacterium]|nr:ATP-binding protein [Candidatus Nealsonbacteria bacterium]